MGGLLLLSGCASFQVGSDFKLTQFASSVEQGVTTQAQVKEWLGNPQSTGVVVERDGQKLTRWMYYYSKGTLSNMNNARMKTLEVQFDQNGIVRAYDWVGE